VRSNTVSGLRYYASGGGPTVVRSSAGSLTYEAGDGQGTMSAELDAYSLTETRRYFTPYGQPRGGAPAWIDNRGFVGQPQDTATGLDLLGAREYDPNSGRFLQRDPIFESSNPNQQGGYAYAGDNPVNGSDPAGTMVSCPMPDGLFCAGSGGGGGGGGGSGGGGSGSSGGGGGGWSGGGGGGTGRPSGGGGTGGTKTGTASGSDTAPRYVISYQDPMACATLLCYQQLSQNAQDISNQIQQQQQTAEDQAMACATQWCHDQIMAGLAAGRDRLCSKARTSRDSTLPAASWICAALVTSTVSGVTRRSG
jgi:RHS repeat-associated protein